MNYILKKINKLDVYNIINKNICIFSDIIKQHHYISNFNNDNINEIDYIDKNNLNNNNEKTLIVLSDNKIKYSFRNHVNIINVPNIYEIMEVNKEIYDNVYLLSMIDKNVIEKELINVNLLFLQIVFGMRILKKNGNLYIKFASISLYNTIDLIELLNVYFNNIKIVKNNNFKNDNRMLICEDFKGISSHEKRYYMNILEDLYYHSNKVLISLFGNKYRYKVLDLIKNSNIEITKKIIERYKEL